MFNLINKGWILNSAEEGFWSNLVVVLVVSQQDKLSKKTVKFSESWDMGQKHKWLVFGGDPGLLNHFLALQKINKKNKYLYYFLINYYTYLNKKAKGKCIL